LRQELLTTSHSCIWVLVTCHGYSVQSLRCNGDGFACFFCAPCQAPLMRTACLPAFVVRAWGGRPLRGPAQGGRLSRPSPALARVAAMSAAQCAIQCRSSYTPSSGESKRDDLVFREAAATALARRRDGRTWHTGYRPHNRHSRRGLRAWRLADPGSPVQIVFALLCA